MVKNKKGEEVTKCPSCGYGEFSVKVRFSGTSVYNICFDDKSADNTNLHDGVIYNLGHKAICANCGKHLGQHE